MSDVLIETVAQKLAARSNLFPTVKEASMSLAGAWILYITTPMGEQKTDLQLAQDISGTITAMDSPAAVYGGELHGESLRFKADVTQPFPMTLAFDVKVLGDAITGQVEVGPLGPAPVRGHRA